ncbi:MAG: methyltransferase domain-containing protein [Thermoleophilaceae bacterium]|nr:methyltransferase domain-containing protein [Thermoleophilaceae bacterium]
MTAEDYRAASRESWGSAADVWARAADEPDSGASALAAEWMLAQAALKPGERVLELAAGAGRVGLQAASIVGPEGRVVCSDFAEAMVKAIRARSQSAGLSNLEARVLDAERLELGEDERFDAVLCRFGYMLMGDPAAALAESARALIPGGRLVLAVWGPGADNPWLMMILQAVMDHFGAPPPEPGTPGPFALGVEQRLEGLLTQAGFTEIAIERLETEQTYDSSDGWWDEITAIGGPLASVLGALPKPDFDAIRGTALAEAARFGRADGALTLPAAIIGAHGRRDYTTSRAGASPQRFSSR